MKTIEEITGEADILSQSEAYKKSEKPSTRLTKAVAAVVLRELKKEARVGFVNGFISQANKCGVDLIADRIAASLGIDLGEGEGERNGTEF